MIVESWSSGGARPGYSKRDGSGMSGGVFANAEVLADTASDRERASRVPLAHLLLVVLLALFASRAPAAVDDEGHTFGFAAVPTATFDTDEGFGTGGVGTLYHFHEGTAPYRDAITANVFISSKLVQHHALTWDALRPFGLDGRFYFRAGYYSTVSQNYCGVGNAVTCAPGDAAAAARAEGLTPDDDEAWDRFTHRYYLMRFLRPYGTAILRPRLRDKPDRVELLLGWRVARVIPGDLGHSTPYPGSLFAHDFPDANSGTSSVPFIGVVVDDRDDEVFPTRGFVAEASVRGAHPFVLSDFTYAGANAQGAAFFSLLDDPPLPDMKVVLAQRLILDGLLGDPPLEDLARIGGTLESIAFGGSAIGRGIREHRYVGKLKALAQTELRAQVVTVRVFEQDFSLGGALFSDLGWIGWDVTALRGEPFRILGTAGASLRMLWNKTFAVRIDLATSPFENDGPGFYIIVGQPF